MTELTTVAFILPALMTAIIAGFVHMGARSYWNGCLRSAVLCTILYCLLATPGIVGAAMQLSYWAVAIPAIAFSVTLMISMVVGIPFLDDYNRILDKPVNELTSETASKALPQTTIADLLIVVTIFGFICGIAVLSDMPVYIAILGFLLIVAFLRFTAS